MAGSDEGQRFITITTLADAPELVPQVVEIAWEEWGAELSDDPRERWLREAEQDSQLHLPTSAGFVAVDDSSYEDIRRMRAACAEAGFLTLR